MSYKIGKDVAELEYRIQKIEEILQKLLADYYGTNKPTQWY